MGVIGRNVKNALWKIK